MCYVCWAFVSSPPLANCVHAITARSDWPWIMHFIFYFFLIQHSGFDLHGYIFFLISLHLSPICRLHPPPPATLPFVLNNSNGKDPLSLYHSALTAGPVSLWATCDRWPPPRSSVTAGRDTRARSSGTKQIPPRKSQAYKRIPTYAEEGNRRLWWVKGSRVLGAKMLWRDHSPSRDTATLSARMNKASLNCLIILCKPWDQGTYWKPPPKRGAECALVAPVFQRVSSSSTCSHLKWTKIYPDDA